MTGSSVILPGSAGFNADIFGNAGLNTDLLGNAGLNTDLFGSALDNETLLLFQETKLKQFSTQFCSNCALIDLVYICIWFILQGN